MKIVIPAYEPDKKLLSLIRDIKENSTFDVIIVNDGSSEKYDFIFRKAENEGCTVLIHKVNREKGAALKTSFKYIIRHNKDNSGVICADCDGQHTWQDIIKLAESLAWHKDTIVLGCREFTGSVPLRSLIGNKITGFIFSFISGLKITDTQTGLRGFPSGMLPWLLQIKGNRYEYEMNQLLEARSSGYKLSCIPIKTIYEKNNKSSHFRPVRDSFQIYLPILKFGLSSMSCGIIDFSALFILNGLTRSLLASVIGARVISSACNYVLNKNMVFKSSHRHKISSVIKYYTLAAVILLFNYLLLDFFTDIMTLSLFTGKLLTEAILFIISYYAQKRYVFL